MELSGSEGFAKLKEVSSALHTEINEKYPLETVDGHFSFADGKYTADQIALTLIPEEIRTGGMLPVNVTADGNCLPRTGSILLFGIESAQEEMRVRIAIEQCLNSDLYIDNNYLNRGENFPEQESKFLDRTYTVFLEQYIPGNKVTKTDTENIFEEETVKICKRGSYMGIWQLFALSSVLKKKITSLYPIIGQSSVKQVLNRSILPRQGDLNEPSVTVMWTSTRTDMVPQHWIPNHFVPLLPTTRLSYFTEMIGDLSGIIDGFDFNEEDADLSLDDSMMDTILTALSSSIPTPDSTATPEGIEEITKTGEVAKWDDDTDLSGSEIQSSNGTKDIDPTFTRDGTSTPDGTPTAEDTGPTPDGTPTPEDTRPTPYGTPTPEDTKPTPDGTPTPEDTKPTPDGTPTPEDTRPTPDGTPTPEDTRPKPDGTPRPNQTEEITIAGGDDVDLPGREIQSRFRTGDYVLVQHGKCLLPAVVDSWP